MIANDPIAPKSPQGLREEIAAVLHMGLDGACPNDPQEGEEGHRRWVERVQEWADWVHEQYEPYLLRPGFAVVELPDPDNHLAREGRMPLWYDPRSGNAWKAHAAGIEDEFGTLRDPDEVRSTALVMLAVSAAVGNLRALGHDGAGPPTCEPCSADCPACTAERQGGDPR